MEHQRLTNSLAQFDMAQKQPLLLMLRSSPQCIKPGFAYGNNLRKRCHSFQKSEFMFNIIRTATGRLPWMDAGRKISANTCGRHIEDFSRRATHYGCPTLLAPVGMDIERNMTHDTI